jgi:hypothetical protein
LTVFGFDFAVTGGGADLRAGALAAGRFVAGRLAGFALGFEVDGVDFDVREPFTGFTVRAAVVREAIGVLRRQAEFRSMKASKR